MIIWLESFPRSGNTFFRILLNRIYGFQTDSIYYSADSANVSRGDTRTLMELMGQSPVRRTLDDLEDDPGVHFVKTHDVIIRDGRDSLVSYAHFVLRTERGIVHPTYQDFCQVLEHLIRSKGFGGWSKNVEAWANRVGDERVICYEELIRNPLGAMARALSDMPIEAVRRGTDVPSFQELQNSVPWFFRRGTVGAWRDEMPRALHELFWAYHYRAMERFGYPRSDPWTERQGVLVTQ